MFASKRSKIAAAVVLLALVALPAPVLPPLGLAARVQALLGISWKAAYFVAAIGLLASLYGALGVVAAFAVEPGEQWRQRWLQLLVLPVIVVSVALGVRSLKLGHWPMLANALVPMVACGFGALIGVLLRQHGWRGALGAVVVLGAGMLWAYWPGVSSELRTATEAQLRRITEAASTLPAGDARFGVLLQTVFTSAPAASSPMAAVEHNRAAILALGIAIGHERLARYAGLRPDSELVRKATAIRKDTTLDGRNDWARHYCLSAALVVVESSFLSDAGGLMKEQLDALTRGSGFSFGDLAADRAGVRFAEAGTASPATAVAMQARLRDGFSPNDFFPPASDLPENLSVEQFRRDYGGVGSRRYRQALGEIEARLNGCVALTVP